MGFSNKALTPETVVLDQSDTYFIASPLDVHLIKFQSNLIPRGF